VRFTAGDLRGSIADPIPTIRRLREALRPGSAPTDTPRSPQRQWIEASLRRYYRASRNPDILIGDYQARTDGKGSSRGKATEIANGEGMLLSFLALDEPEPTPRIAMQTRTNQPVVGHTISMGHDLVYERPDGYLVREIWTDGVVRRLDHRRLMQAASLLHADQLLGRGRVQELEVWHLRFGFVEAMRREEAYELAPSLRAVLDNIALRVQT
jgi:hypothetical protein